MILYLPTGWIDEAATGLPQLRPMLDFAGADSSSSFEYPKASATRMPKHMSHVSRESESESLTVIFVLAMPRSCAVVVMDGLYQGGMLGGHCVSVVGLIGSLVLYNNQIEFDA
jgi:hypothetical protein